jgi:hypothetical protein
MFLCRSDLWNHPRYSQTFHDFKQINFFEKALLCINVQSIHSVLFPPAANFAYEALCFKSLKESVAENLSVTKLIHEVLRFILCLNLFSTALLTFEHHGSFVQGLKLITAFGRAWFVWRV